MNIIKKAIYTYLVPFIGRITRSRNKYINVIYYHDIVRGEGDSFQKTNIKIFKKHMRYLAEHHFTTLRFDDLDSDSIMFDPKKVLIAFDDGWLSNYTEIYDFMQALGLKYNIYLTVGKIGTDTDFLDWDQVKKMHKEGNVGFGVHTYNHTNVSQIKSIDPDIEFTKANNVFEQNLGFAPLDFCYPYGAYSSDSNKFLIENSPYIRIYTSDPSYTYKQDNRYIFGRCGIRNEEPFIVFKSKAKGLHNIFKNLTRL